MKTIPLTQGYVAFIDDEDYEEISKFKWCVHRTTHGNLYAGRRVRNPDGTGNIKHLHKFLIPGAEEVHHLDGDGLNNTRENLRASTHLQNLQGFQKKRAGTSSQFRGVSWNKGIRKWESYITVNKKRIGLGYFKEETDAARAYDAAAKKYFVFPAPNFLVKLCSS